MKTSEDGMQAFLKPIVEVHFPEEIDAFDLGASDRIRNVYDNNMMEGKILRDEINFLSEAKSILDIFKLIDGTIKTVSNLKKKEENCSPEQVLRVQNEWMNTLVSHGMDPVIANDIATRFSLDLLNFFKSSENY